MNEEVVEHQTHEAPSTWAGGAYYVLKLLGKYQIPLITILILGAGGWGIWSFLSDTFTKFTEVQSDFSKQVAKFQKSQIDSADKVLEIQGKVVEKTTSVLKLIDEEVGKRRDAVAKQTEAEKLLSDREASFRQMETDLASKTGELQKTVERLNLVTEELKKTTESKKNLQIQSDSLQTKLNEERKQVLTLANDIVLALKDEKYMKDNIKSVYNKAASYISVDTEAGKKWFESFSKKGIGFKGNSSIIGISHDSIESIVKDGVCNCSWHSFRSRYDKGSKYLVTRKNGDNTEALVLSLHNNKLVSIEKIGSVMLVDAFSSTNFIIPKYWLVKMDKSSRLFAADEIRNSESSNLIDLALSGFGADTNTIKNLNPAYVENTFPKISVHDYLQKFPKIIDEDDGQYGFGRILRVANNASRFNTADLSSLNVYEMSQTKAKDEIINFLVDLGKLDWKSASSHMLSEVPKEDVGALSVGIHEPDFRLATARIPKKDDKLLDNKVIYTFKYGLERHFANKGQTDVTMVFDEGKKAWLITEVFNYSAN